MTITIIGGGSLSHVCAGFLGAQEGVEVRILTRRPQLWQKEIVVTDPDGKIFRAPLSVVSDCPEDVVTNSDIVLFCLPGYAIEEELRHIKPFIGEAIVGSVVCNTGFFFMAHEILGTEAQLFGFQRVPFIARLTEYGRSANLLGYKSSLSMVVENVDDAEAFRQTMENLLHTPTKLLGSFYDVSLSNSNPILHTGRLYTMFHDWDGTPFDHNILFYKEWTDEASQKIIDMDAELQQLLTTLPVTPCAIPTLLDYYESHDAASLTRKLQSIPAFENILSPMKEVAGGWVPDYESRYFREDFAYGLKWIAEKMEGGVCWEVWKWGEGE